MSPKQLAQNLCDEVQMPDVYTVLLESYRSAQILNTSPESFVEVIKHTLCELAERNGGRWHDDGLFLPGVITVNIDMKA